MNTTSPESQFETLFGNIQVTPGQRFYSRMSRAAWTPAGIDRRRTVALIGVMVLLLAALLAFTSQGRTLAQSVVRSFLGYFIVTDKKSLPLPATPQPVPTYMFEPALVPFEPRSTPAAGVAQCGASVSELTSSPYCLMLNAQAETGFPIKVFGAGDVPLNFDVVGTYTGSVYVSYFNEDSPEIYSLSQGRGDFPADGLPWSLVQAEAVQQVMVGNHPGEMVLGQFVNYTGKPTLEWDTTLPGVHLRWREADHWYSIEGNRYYWYGYSTAQPAEQKKLINTVLALGQDLVPLSTGPEKMGGKVDQLPQDRLGFRVLTPKALPEGFEQGPIGFGNKYEGLDGAINLNYQFIHDGQWASAIEISEAAVTNPDVDFVRAFTEVNIIPKYLLTINDLVSVGNATGRYMFKPDGSTALVWYREGVKLMIQPIYDVTTFGGRFTKAELIAIAESVK